MAASPALNVVRGISNEVESPDHARFNALMLEKEVKFLEVDVPAITHCLHRAGAERVFEGVMDAVYFDHQSASLAKKGRSVRLRAKGEDLIELTVKEKRKKNGVKVCEEAEVIVSCRDQMEQILRLLGLVPFRRIRKKRISYMLDGAHVELDTLPDIPTFIEIEAARISVIRQTASLLGLHMTDAKPWSTADVLRYYGKKR